MYELRGLLLQTDGHAVEDDEVRAAVANGLSNLPARERLQLFRLAADEHDCFGVSNIFVRRERRG